MGIQLNGIMVDHRDLIEEAKKVLLTFDEEADLSRMLNSRRECDALIQKQLELITLRTQQARSDDFFSSLFDQDLVQKLVVIKEEADLKLKKRAFAAMTEEDYMFAKKLDEIKIPLSKELFYILTYKYEMGNLAATDGNIVKGIAQTIAFYENSASDFIMASDQLFTLGYVYDTWECFYGKKPLKDFKEVNFSEIPFDTEELKTEAYRIKLNMFRGRCGRDEKRQLKDLYKKSQEYDKQLSTLLYSIAQRELPGCFDEGHCGLCHRIRIRAIRNIDTCNFIKEIKNIIAFYKMDPEQCREESSKDYAEIFKPCGCPLLDQK